MIRRALPQELPAILRLYAEARSFMAKQGNPTQWGKSSPAQSVLEEDIRKKRLYVCVRNGRLCGVFAFPIGKDPTYQKLEDGSWISDSRYGTIHRLAGERTEKGIFEECLSWCRCRISHIRIDTHEDNRIMRHLIEKNGFSRRGIIHVADGSPRIAYEWEAGGGEKDAPA
ncbi:MAG TPA: N-acetyltransferase [Candidatus Eisenbergiella merdipullorum]|uniref:N-acetyltransferase n=1 Tax=Candidatus Eisenbergiella merdipullorum TaxID=2838553 RepID=A0A9D2KZ94_9FIRM|nr:N-acetyltransferase [Candidatus Eisenbergiella merdipullorum]